MAADLFGEGAAAEKARKPRAKKAPGAAPAIVSRAIEHYHNEHIRRFGCKPIIVGGRDGRILKDLAAAVGDEELLQLITAFLFSTDWKIRGSGYTVPDLKFHAARVRLQTHGNGRPATDPRMAETIDAATRAVGRRKP